MSLYHPLPVLRLLTLTMVHSQFSGSDSEPPPLLSSVAAGCLLSDRPTNSNLHTTESLPYTTAVVVLDLQYHMGIQYLPS